jgi:hypothetical protein
VVREILGHKQKVVTGWEVLPSEKLRDRTLHQILLGFRRFVVGGTYNNALAVLAG